MIAAGLVVLAGSKGAFRIQFVPKFRIPLARAVISAAKLLSEWVLSYYLARICGEFCLCEPYDRSWGGRDVWRASSRKTVLTGTFWTG